MAKPKRDKPLFSAMGGSWVSSTTYNSEKYDARTGSKDTSYREALEEFGEPGVYENREWTSNEDALFDFCHWSLVASLMNFRVKGPGKEDIEKFFHKISPSAYLELSSALRAAIQDGSGIYRKWTSNSRLKQIKWDSTYNYELEWVHRKSDEDETERDKKLDEDAIDGERRHIEIAFVQDTEKEIRNTTDEADDNRSVLRRYYLREYPCIKKEDYYNPDISLIRLRLDDQRPYGKAIGRSSYEYFKALSQALKDNMAVIKKLLGTPMFAALDLQDLDDDEKVTAQQTFRDSLNNIDWNTTDLITYDNRHEMGYGGLMKGMSPTGDGKIIDIMKHITPVLSVVLLNFFIPIGIIQQTGANKSLIAEQVVQARKDIKPLQQAWISHLKTQLFPQITDKDYDIYYPPFGVSYEMWNNFFTSGLVSRETTQDELGIVDYGKTYGPEIGAQTTAMDSTNTTNNDDNPGGRSPKKRGDET